MITEVENLVYREAKVCAKPKAQRIIP